jgi:hypothetical protein
MELIGAGILYIIGLIIGWLLYDETEQAKRR